MASYALMARDAGARIIGGCCGTTPGHLRAMAKALKCYTPGGAPEKADIEATLGPIDEKPSAAVGKRRSRKR